MAADDQHSTPAKPGRATVTGAAISPTGSRRPKERVPFKPELTEINQYLMCSLCSGYLIDATAIIECQHTFCKSCILKYLETNGYCPICDIELNTVKPHLSLRSDVIVQRLVYKLVPGLLVSELRRRREHAECQGIPKTADSISTSVAAEVDSASDSSTILSLDDVVSLSIEYFRSEEEENIMAKEHPVPKKLDHNTSVSRIPSIDEVKGFDKNDNEDKANDRRYLKCPAAVSVGLLKKFIRMKYGLSDDYRVDLLYNGERDHSLETDLTLLDIAFISKWNKDEPMHFHYRIFERNLKSFIPRPGSKRPASSMMDEPPDDDASSGSHNRPPMTSTSSSTKLPRMSSSTASGASTPGANTGGSARTNCTLSSSKPVYDFSEGNSDSEDASPDKGKLKLRGYRKGNSTSEAGRHSLKRAPSSQSSGVEMNRRSSGTNTSPQKGKESSGKKEGDSSEDEDSDSSADSVAALTNSRVRSAAETVLQSQLNGGLKLNLPSNGEKREPLKLSLKGSVTSKAPDHKHKHKHHHKMKHKKKHKPLKIILSPNANKGSNSPANQTNNNSKPVSKSVKVTGEKGSTKLIFGLGRNNPGGEGAGSRTINKTSANNQSNLPANVKQATSAHLTNISKSISVSVGVGNSQSNSSGTQLPNKTFPPTNLLPKNTGIEIQPRSGPAQGQGQNIQHVHGSSSNVNSGVRSHPLLPESVHVPKSVTLIPVNPGTMGNSGSGTSNMGRMNVGGSVQEKSSSNTNNNSSTRLNAQTFIHPKTNKSLHQITVTEVPAPSNKPTGGNSSSSGGNANNSSSVVSSEPSNLIEKVIANAANKPQFNGPGSMEITKIYCNAKDVSSAKKLKERKGLDISITVPPGSGGMNKNKKPQKIEESLRQKMGLNTSGTGMTITNKMKGSNQPSGPLFNTKMPPGITIGPVGTNKSISVNSSSGNSANTLPGLGFTLPPHITAHPQQQPPKHLQTQTKTGEKSMGGKSFMGHNKSQHNNNNLSQINKAKEAVVQSNKIMNNNSAKSMDNNNRRQMGNALASMIDMANRNAIKSPSPPKTKDVKQVKPSQPVVCEKRGIDMSSLNRKNSRDSPDLKRPKISEAVSKNSETPLDLSSAGRSSRPNSTDSPSSTTTVSCGKVSSCPSPSFLEKKRCESPVQPRKSPTPASKASLNTNTSTTTNTATSPGFPSPPGGKSGSKGNTPTGSPSILSIAHSLAQKQLNQQQKEQHQLLQNQLLHLQNVANQSANNHQQQSGKSHNAISPKSGSTPPLGLSSLSPPGIPMPNPSPPGTGFDPLRNLLTLSDAAAAVRHGKMHPMGLMAAVGLCPPPPHSHPGLSLPSPAVTSASLFPHLVGQFGGKSPMDPSTQAYLAAISAHNERLAVAAGMGHYRESLSPPMSIPNSFMSQVRPPSSISNPHGSLRNPSVPPKSNSASAPAGKKGSPTPPLSYSHPPTTVFPSSHSPTKSSSLSPSSSSAPASSSSHSTIKSQDSSSGLKNTKINGASFPSHHHLPIIPPGIHNPLLSIYSRSTTSSTQNHAGVQLSGNKGTNLEKSKGIPNSMKISNFLPSKPKDGNKDVDSSNVEATITSASTFGSSKFLNSITPSIVSQSQSNLSVSSTKDSSRVTSLHNKSKSEQECGDETKTGSPSVPQNPIKRESDKPIILSNTTNNPLKPSSADPITCQRSGTSPVPHSKMNEASDKLNSPEIKSEVTSLAGSSKGGVELTPTLPVAARTTQAQQPQNQAVRYIPNPALLFNRQSGSHSMLKHSPTSPSLPSDANSGKSLPFSSKSPLKLDEKALQVPSLPFPGVSVPVQVKVENGPLPIPIVVDNANPKQQLSSSSQQPLEEENPSSVSEMSPCKEKVKKIEEKQSKSDEVAQEETTTNPICTQDDIVKIEQQVIDDADADQEIDVGSELMENVEVNDTTGDEKVEKMENVEEEKDVPNTSSSSPIKLEGGASTQDNESGLASSQDEQTDLNVKIEFHLADVEIKENKSEELDSTQIEEEACEMREKNETDSQVAAAETEGEEEKMEHEEEDSAPANPAEEEEERRQSEIVEEQKEVVKPSSSDVSCGNGESESDSTATEELPGNANDETDEQAIPMELEGDNEKVQQGNQEVPQESEIKEECDTEVFNKTEEPESEQMECEEAPVTSSSEIEEPQPMDTDDTEPTPSCPSNSILLQEIPMNTENSTTSCDINEVESNDDLELKAKQSETNTAVECLSFVAEEVNEPEDSIEVKNDDDDESKNVQTATLENSVVENVVANLITSASEALSSDKVQEIEAEIVQPENVSEEELVVPEQAVVDVESDSVIPLDNKEQFGEETGELMESTALSQSDLNCPSTDTNDPKSSNLSTEMPEEISLPIPFKNENFQSEDNALEHTEENSGSETIIPSSNPDVELKDTNIVEEASSTSLQWAEGCAIIISDHELEMNQNSEDSQNSSQQVNKDQEPESQLISSEFSSPTISATATITATEAEDPSIEVEGEPSNCSEFPLSPGEKQESVDEVSTELFSTSASAINNNNNKTLTISGSACDIPITTSSSDVATV